MEIGFGPKSGGKDGKPTLDLRVVYESENPL
jgi:hypothetical protein